MTAASALRRIAFPALCLGDGAALHAVMMELSPFATSAARNQAKNDVVDSLLTCQKA